MITLFGKTVYKVLMIFKNGKRLVSPVYSFEYEPGKVYTEKKYNNDTSAGFYSYEDIETARRDTKNITGGVLLGVFKCRIPWFSKYEVLGGGNIRSEKIKIKERI